MSDFKEEMRIAVDALPAVPSKSGAVGMFRNILRIAPTLDPSLKLVYFVSPAQKEYYEKYLPLEFRNQVHFSVINIDSSNRISRISAQLLLVPKECRKQDVNILFSLNPEPLFPIRGVHEVFKVVDLQFLDAPEEFSLWKREYRKFMGRRKIKRSDLIIANSEYTKQRIIDHFSTPEDRIHIIYEAVDHDLFHVADNLEASKRLISENYRVAFPYILYVSSFRPYKNHISLIKAYQELINSGVANHHLVLIGNDIHDYRSFVEKFVMDIGLANYVHFLDYVHHWDLPAFYHAASLSVYPSLYETFGIPPLEAMACGIPVIISNRTCMPEVSGGGADIIDPDDCDQFCESMKRVLTDTSYANLLTTRGLDWCQQYTWQQSITQTINSFRIFSKSNLSF